MRADEENAFFVGRSYTIRGPLRSRSVGGKGTPREEVGAPVATTFAMFERVVVRRVL